MAALIGWELKKLFSRRFTWLLLAAGLAFFVLVNWSTVDTYGLSGYVRGMKDVYRQYDGQVITEAFQAQVKQDFNRFAASHPDRFELKEYDMDGTGTTSAYYSASWGYDTGFWDAYQTLGGVTSLEDNRQQVQSAQKALSTGVLQDGTVMTAYLRRYEESLVRYGAATPIARYAEGWQQFLYTSPVPGWLALAIPCIALLGLFNGEFSARMDAVFLSAKARQRATLAKLWAGALVSAGVVTTYFGAELLLIAGVWGLDGGATAWGSLPGGWINIALPVAAVYMIGLLAILVAQLACSAVVMWASARFRHPLVALLMAGILIFVMVLPNALLSGYFTGFWVNSPFWVAFHEYSALLPAAMLLSLDTPLRAVARPETFAFALAFPLALITLLCWLSHHAFLRRRRT